ncbi:hypothetical protein E2320_014519, partial [Naja naja]
MWLCISQRSRGLCWIENRELCMKMSWWKIMGLWPHWVFSPQACPYLSDRTWGRARGCQKSPNWMTQISNANAETTGNPRERPYACVECEEQAQRSSTFMDHWKMNPEEEAYECLDCRGPMVLCSHTHCQDR